LDTDACTVSPFEDPELILHKSDESLRHETDDDAEAKWSNPLLFPDEAFSDAPKQPKLAPLIATKLDPEVADALLEIFDGTGSWKVLLSLRSSKNEAKVTSTKKSFPEPDEDLQDKDESLTHVLRVQEVPLNPVPGNDVMKEMAISRGRSPKFLPEI
jgi:hypothetical protein